MFHFNFVRNVAVVFALLALSVCGDSHAGQTWSAAGNMGTGRQIQRCAAEFSG